MVVAKSPAKKSKKKLQVNPEIKAKAAAKKSKGPALDMPKKLKKLTSRLIKFDGDLAQAWIDHDIKVREMTKTCNRKLTTANVKAKVEHMMAGSYMTTSQGLTIDFDGAVIDGQHTLNAIVMYYDKAESPEPITLYVTEGEDPSHFPFYDQGKTRSNEDVFAMANFNNPRELSVASRLLWIRMMGRRVSGAGKMSPYALVEFAKPHKKLIKSIDTVIKFGREDNEEDQGDRVKSVMSEGYAAALHFLMVNAEGSSQEKADEFWDLLVNPEPKSKLAPCVLRRKIQRIQNGESRMDRDWLVNGTIQAFNRFVDGDLGNFEISKLDEFTLGGLDASLSPESDEE